MTPLRQRMIDDLRLRNYSPKTVAAYTSAVEKFARFFGEPPDRLGSEDVRRWQLHLLDERRASWSAFNIAVSALRFFYGVTLAGPEFLRRFLLHVLPRGFMKVRSYGLLANCQRRAKLARCRELLETAAGCADAPVVAGPPEADEAQPAPPCPACGQGRMNRIDSSARPSVAELLSRPFHFDTS